MQQQAREEDHSVIFSIDGGETWELQGTHGQKMSAKSMGQLRYALGKRYGQVKVWQVQQSRLHHFGIYLKEA